MKIKLSVWLHSIFMLVLAVAARDLANHSRFIRSASKDCINSDKVESTISVAYTTDGYKPESRKQEALEILSWYRNWLTEFNTRQSFKAQKGEISGFMWVGSMVQNSGFSKNVIPDFIEEINKYGMPQEIYYEFLHNNAMQTFGIILTVRGLEKAQKAVKRWSAGKPYEEKTGSKNTGPLSICYLAYGNRKRETNDGEAGPCDYKRVEQGQNVGGNVGEYLEAFNQGLDFTKLGAEQPYCYTEGTSPDFRPHMDPNGNCATSIIKSGDSCGALAAKYSPLTVKDIESYNQQTYGWKGCNFLQIDQPICVSEGKAPRPTPTTNAECGPLAPGDFYDQECPNRACCSDFGFCGLTSEFCELKYPDGAPGTRGCYSNCGYGSLPTKKASSFQRVAYWLDIIGPLYMSLNDIDAYNSIHYAFATVNDDMTIGVGAGFESFKRVTQKKIVSFGGWEFSTSTNTYQLLRRVVSDSEREIFARNVVEFMKAHNLDGVDFDWEYPEAPDIPNIPAGQKGDGKRYAELMKRIKELDNTKTVSVAIPASYWYLKGFPLAQLDSIVDYYVLMNYDYVGQWDYGKPDTGIGCHNDRSLTEAAIKMIVKAGIDTTKVYGGLANYGRSFKLTDKNCRYYKCPFKGPDASALSGDMTLTPGFLSIGEISQLAITNELFNATSKCFDGLYNNGEDWVAWMKDSDLGYTEAWYREDLGLGGSALWLLNYYKKYDDNMLLTARKSYSRDLNRKPSLYSILGGNYKRMLRIRRLLSYLYDLINQKKYKSSAAATIKSVRRCSENVFNELENNYDRYERADQEILHSLPYLFTADEHILKSSDYVEAMETLTSTNVNLKRFKKVCEESTLRNFIVHRNQLVTASASLYMAIETSSQSLYTTVVETARPVVQEIEPGRIFGDEPLHQFDDFRNELSESEVEDDDQDLDYVPDISPQYPYPHGMSGDDYERAAFHSLPSRQVLHNLHRLCLFLAADQFNKCLQRLDTLRYHPNTARNLVLQSNNHRVLGSTNTPLYVVNMGGRSVGAACNALLYFLSGKGDSHKLSIGGMFYLTRGKKKSRYFLRKYATCFNTPNTQKDEFPPSSVEEGVHKEKQYRHYTSNVCCVDYKDNQREGTNLNRFFGGFKSRPDSENDECRIDWSGILPNEGSSRRPAIKEGQKFYVMVNIGLDVDCSKYVKIPKVKTRDGYTDNRDGVRVNSRLSEHDEL